MCYPDIPLYVNSLFCYILVLKALLSIHRFSHLLDYSCALQRDILIHGRLYVTQSWLCFYANIFSWETLVCN